MLPAGNAISHQRGLKGLTQEELAEKAGYSKRTIERIENGDRTKFATLEDIATVLEVSAESLISTSLSIRHGPGIEIIVRGSLGDYPQHVQDKVTQLVTELIGHGECVSVRQGSIILGYRMSRPEALRVSAAFLHGAFSGVEARDIVLYDKAASTNRPYTQVSFEQQPPFLRLAQRLADRFRNVPIVEDFQDAAATVVADLLTGDARVNRVGSIVKWFRSAVYLEAIGKSLTRSRRQTAVTFFPAADMDIAGRDLDPMTRLLQAEFWQRLTRLLLSWNDGPTVFLNGRDFYAQPVALVSLIQGESIGELSKRIDWARSRPSAYRLQKVEGRKRHRFIRTQLEIAMQTIQPLLIEYSDEFLDGVLTDLSRLDLNAHLAPLRP